MKYKGLSIIAGSSHTEKAILEQIKEYIPPDLPVNTWSLENKIPPIPPDHLLLITSCMIIDHIKDVISSCDEENVIIANRTIGHDMIEHIFLIPANTSVLFVNDVEETSRAGIQQLQKLGIDYLNFIPYYPGIKGEITKAKIAITPGEVDKVPPFVEKVYNMGSRILDFTTITKILTRLEMLDTKAGLFSEKYLRKIINIGKKLSDYTNRIENLNENLFSVMDGLASGLLSYDLGGNVEVVNEKFKKMLNLKDRDLIGANLRNFVYSKTLLQFLLNPESEETRILELYNESFLIKKIAYSQNHVLAVFKSMKTTLDESSRIRAELVKKGFFAKYKLNDIKGTSPQMQKVKTIARKLAPTELTLLIEGESGTGKELLASAIHNLSSRKNGPFIPVNFSALPDELVESELFGYERGAFTGARKEGHIGIFEQADGGTIFLDEIGDISLKVQTKILRVLQEKEIMRIGGDEIKKVDVRIITATNRNLPLMIKNSQFREDLFYRLKVGYIYIPPLRKRKNDIPQIINHLLSISAHKNLKISENLMYSLLKNPWFGNVRELENTINYIVAISEDNILNVNDLPDPGYFTNNNFNESFQEDALILPDEDLELLKLIFVLQKQGVTVGRDILAQKSNSLGNVLTPTQVRSKLKKLHNLQLINQKRGKHGTVLTVFGKNILQQYNT